MAVGDFVQAAADQDLGSTLTFDSGSDSTGGSGWATPTSGNTLICFFGGDNFATSFPTGWTQRDTGPSSNPYWEVWDKVSDGTESTIAITVSASDAHAIIVEMEGDLAYDTGDDNTNTGTSVAINDTPTLQGAGFAVASAFHWTAENVTVSSGGYTLRLNYDDGNNGKTWYENVATKAVTTAADADVTMGWSTSSDSVGITGVWYDNSTTDATPTPSALAATTTFGTSALSTGAGLVALPETMTLPGVTVSVGSQIIPSVLNGVTTFPTATASATNDATATLTVLAATATFDTVTAVAVDGVVVSITPLVISPTTFPTPTVSGVQNRTVTLTALTVTTTLDTPAVFAGVSATATAVSLSSTFTFGAVTATGQVSVNVSLSIINVAFYAFPQAIPVATELSYFYNTDVSVAVEVAFDDYPLVATPTWYDITGSCYGFTVTRGRQNELDNHAAGKATVTLDASTGNFDPSNNAGTYYPGVKPMRQIRIRAAYGSVTYTLFRGFVERWPLTVAGFTDETVNVSAVDGFKTLNLAKDSTAQTIENSGTRVGHLLDEAGWPNAWRTIGTGAATIPAYTPACGTSLSLIRQVTDSEGGQFYISADGQATFRNRTYRSGLSPQATLGPAVGQVPYHGITPDYDDSQIWNQIQVNIGGFPSQVANSTSSHDLYGIRTLPVNDILLPNSTDGDDLAQAYLSRYQIPRERVEKIVVKPEASPALCWPQVLGRDLSEKATIVFESRAGVSKSLPSFIEGIRHTVTMRRQRTWRTELRLSQIE